MSEINLPVKKWNYYKGYSSDNYGSHCQAISIKGLTLYFSYDTVVAFIYEGNKYVSENCWASTTGKHLNSLCPDKSRRLKREIFEKLLNQVLVDFKWSQVLE